MKNTKKIIIICLSVSIFIVSAVCLAIYASHEKKAREPNDLPEETECTTNIETDEKQTVPQRASFQLESLPDIGRYDAKTMADRWYDTYQDHLIARNDYGALVPFIGVVQDFGNIHEIEGAMPETSFRYGLMTTDGKIVVDAVYKWISVDTAPNGEMFYLLSVYDQTNVPASQIHEEDPGECRSSYLVNIKGSKILEIPYSHFHMFTKDRVVLIPNAYAEAQEGSAWYDCVAVYDMNFQRIKTLSNTAMAGYSANEGGAPVMRCGCLYFYDQEGYRFYDLEGNRILRNEKNVSHVEEFGDYILLFLGEDKQKLVDISGRDRMPTVHKGMSVQWVEGETAADETMLCVEQDNGFQCYDASLQPVGSIHAQEPRLAMIFGKVCYQSQEAGADALTYCELATDKPIDWSKNGDLDMSQFAQDYDTYNSPYTIGNRFFVYEHFQSNEQDDSVYHRDVIDLQSGKTILQTEDHQKWGYADRWLLFKDYNGASDDVLLDLQTQSVIYRKSFLEVFEVDGTAYCVGIRNGFSFVENLNTEKILLRMFVASAG